RSSDERFNAAMKSLVDGKAKAAATTWQAADGTKPVSVSEDDRRLVMTFDKRVNPKLGAFIEVRLQALYDQFRDATKEHYTRKRKRPPTVTVVEALLISGATRESQILESLSRVLRT